ncbi:MAG: SLC13 family permease [Anaerolineae bacterium]|jgi:di/tricarboxylate transporter
MSTDAILTLIILVATLLALATRRLRTDLTALSSMLALILTGVLTPTEAFSAFGQPVIAIVASVFVLGAGIYDTGVAAMVASRIVRVSDRGLGVLLLVLMLAAGLMSSVLGSLLVVAALMPAVLRIARQSRQPASQLLLPMVAAATMGNLLTLIGTVSNIVVSDLLVASGQEPLGFFSLLPYGVVSLLLAIVWFLYAGRKLLRRDMVEEPQPPTLDEVEHAYDLDRQLYRLRVRSHSDLAGQRLADSGLRVDFGLNVLAVRRHGGNLQPASPDWMLERDDILVVEGPRGDILQAASLHHLEPKGTMPLDEFNQLEGESLRMAELMVPFRSQLVGRTLAQIGFRERYGLNIVAVHRGQTAIHDNLPQCRLETGDALLVQGPIAYLRQIDRDLNLVMVTHLGPQLGDRITAKAGRTLAILALMVTCVVTGLLPLATASLAAVLLLILTRCISVGRAYRSIDGSLLVLIGGMLPLAMALEKTGIAGLVAGYLASLSDSIGPAGVLLLVYLFAVAITQVVSNSVAAALITPVAVNLALAMDLSPQTFAIAIAIAVGASYATSLTNADFLLVRDAGRYTMRDYLVAGLPLFLLQTAAIMILLLMGGLS